MSTEVFNGNARDLSDFGEVKVLRKTTPVKGVELSVAVEVETAEGVKYQGEPGHWLLEAEDGRRWTCDAAYVEANYEVVGVDLGPVPPDFDPDAAAAAIAEAQDASGNAELPSADDGGHVGTVTSSTLTEGQKA